MAAQSNTVLRAMRVAKMLEHGVQVAQEMIGLAHNQGIGRTLKASAIRVGSAISGATKPGWAGFKTSWAATARAPGENANFMSQLGTFGDSLSAKGALLKTTGQNWWHGKPLGGGQANLNRAVLRQTMAIGGGLMVGKSLLFDRHNRRSY